MWQIEATTFRRIQPKKSFIQGNEGFFFYAGLFLFIAQFFVPNFTTLPTLIFRIVLSLITAAIEFWLYKRLRSGNIAGTLVFRENMVLIYDDKGIIDQQFPRSDVKKVLVFDGLPSGLFGFSEEYKTQIIEFLFHNGQILQIECETTGRIGQQPIMLKEYAFSFS